jgi:TMEM175 potassium channel family protein
MDRSRLEAFSDGVFAVAITLLALNIAVEGPAAHISLAHQLGSRWPTFVAYLISFFTIGIIWVNHHSLIRSIKTVNRTLLFVNLGLLLFVVLIPFSTAVAAEYLSRDNFDTKVAIVLYAGVFLGMSLSFGAIFEWTLHGDRVYQLVPREQHWATRLRFAGGAGVYLIAMGIALVSAYASFILLGLTAVYYIFEHTPAAAAAGPDVPDDDGSVF